MPVDGGSPTMITDTPGDECCPVWTPDGKTIVYELTQGNSDLWTVDVSGLLKGK
jgi:Tol biopolymer transport system component